MDEILLKQLRELNLGLSEADMKLIVSWRNDADCGSKVYDLVHTAVYMNVIDKIEADTEKICDLIID